MLARTVARVLMLLASLVLAIVLVVVWARVVQTLIEPVQKRPPIGQPRAIVWNDRVFTTDGQLKAYLDAHNLSYSRWVSLHPAAFAVLQHTLPRSATASGPVATTRAAAPAPATPAETAPPAGSATAGARAGGGSSFPWSAVLVALAMTLSGVLSVSALVPARVSPRPVRRLYANPERRVAILVGALAVFGTFLVSLYVG